MYIEVNEEGAFSFHDSLCTCLDFDTSKGTMVIVIMGHFDKNSKHLKQDKKQHKKAKETRTEKEKAIKQAKTNLRKKTKTKSTVDNVYVLYSLQFYVEFI